jgi:hypothetical protein
MHPNSLQQDSMATFLTTGIPGSLDEWERAKRSATWEVLAAVIERGEIVLVLHPILRQCPALFGGELAPGS